jgi:GT2 family glycosyltransferase
MTDMGLLVVIVSYNTKDMTLACLESLAFNSPQVEYEIIVVDNGSTDGSALAIEREHPKIRLIKLGENVGFARANNLAVRNSVGKFILLLNSDTIVMGDAINNLLRFAGEYAKAGIWGGRTLFADGTLNPTSCWRFMSLWSIFTQSVGLASFLRRSPLANPEAYVGWQRDSVRQVDIVTGCFLLVTRELWEQLDGFDERFFMYAEEADFCFRARLVGARPLFCPDAVIVHYGGASQSSQPVAKNVQWLAGRVRLMRKHWPRLRATCGRALLVLLVLARVLAFGLISACTGRKASQALGWATVWKRRQEWIKGY